MDIEHLTPAQALQRQRGGAVLVDVRETHERAQGQAEGAQGIALARLLEQPADFLTDASTQIVLICQSGQRSLAAAQALLGQGYTRLATVEGGTTRWRAEGLPMVVPELEAGQRDFGERYARHLLLPEVGEAGQRRLLASRVLLVGAGGLGSPAAYYLAAAGVGQLRIVDDDAVERSNLQRQILHTEARIGMAKVHSAAAALEALNPGVTVQALQTRLDADNVAALLDGVDVVIDGADNFRTRYVLNDACVSAGKPLVYGAVQQFEGQVSVFDAGRQPGRAPCYRCLFPVPPPAGLAPDCAEAGVLGVLPGVIGLLQATEAIKLLLQVGTTLAGRLLNFDALSMRFHELALPVDPTCPVCAVTART